MLTQMLITAAKEAKYYREEDGESSPTYKESIDKIDEINHYIRATNPEKYWQDTDPDYRKLTSQWEAHRAVAKARNAD
jgi:hypothetical protein